MPSFSEVSKKKLETCHPDLQRLFLEVIKHVDCTIIDGFRNKAEQDKAFMGGKSKVRWPNGKHNKSPSLAVDVMPYPIDWSSTPANLEKLNYFAGIVMGIALKMNIKIRWGHDWDGDIQPDQKGLIDRPHFELV